MKKKLRSETEITANWGNMKPLVSICCTAYNQEEYIEDALFGFLIQETNFPYEILIHDDASTDATGRIIREYQKNYPNVIKAILQDENQYSKGLLVSLTYNFSRVRGGYIALCEGDDYWTDPRKLQKQYDFMENNLECSICFHAVLNSFDDTSKNFVHKPNKEHVNKMYNLEDAISAGGGFMATNSMFFRSKYVTDMPDFYMQSPVGDLPLMLVLGSYGHIGYEDSVMSVYRRASNGSWNMRMRKSVKMRRIHYLRIKKMWNDFDEWSEYKYNSYIKEKLSKNFWKYIRFEMWVALNALKKCFS